MFAGPVRLRVGRLEKRDPFAWADLLLDSPCAAPRVEADLLLESLAPSEVEG
jgi:hypothetical protein